MTHDCLAAAVLLILGLAAVAYGLRRQNVKTPHQRELEKIYRYHSGIIIQAKRPPDLDHKNIVVIKNFDDILNLEEELKTPIIASKVTDYTTHFFIANDNIIYVYTVGVMIPFKDTAPNSTA